MAKNEVDLEKLTSWSSDWSQIKVAVVGLGKTGFSVADTLNELGSKLFVVAESAAPETLDILDVLGVECVIDQSPDALLRAMTSFGPDLVIVSPGVMPTS